jgi:DNA polymerase I-like protein with 3'-5' exonuclease and polymerase domains
LCNDKVGREEILAGHDQHAANQDFFKLPSRLIAKKFLFRAIFRGSAYAYANDPEFMGASTNKKYWEEVIERFYTKYEGIAKQHEVWIKQATRGELITIPTGRSYKFEPRQNRRGEMEWPDKDIVNHPVQGLGAEMVKEYRIGVHRRMEELRPAVLFGSIHDQLGLDTPDSLRYNVRSVLNEEAERVPRYMNEYYGMDFDLPFRVEVSLGNNMYDLLDEGTLNKEMAAGRSFEDVCQEYNLASELVQDFF